MPRNCSRTATLATWTILSALWGGLASGQLAEELAVGGKSAYGGTADVVVVSIYDARKNEAGGRQDGCALKRVIQAPSESEIAGNGEGLEEGGSRGIIRPSKVTATGLIEGVLCSGNSKDAASQEATYGEYKESEDSGRSGRSGGEADNSVDGPKDASKDAGKDAEAGGAEGRGGSRSESYGAIEEATLDPETLWIFGRTIKWSEGRSNEQVGRNDATSANRRGAGTRKLETSPQRDAQPEGGSRKSLAIGVSRSFGTSRHGGRRSRRELSTGDGTGVGTGVGTGDGTGDETGDGSAEGNGDNVRGNLQFQDLIPKSSGRTSNGKRTSPCDSSNELGSATTEYDPGRVSREKIRFDLVTATNRDLDFLVASRDLVYRSILKQKSTNWHHSVPESSFNYERSTLPQLKLPSYPEDKESTVFRTYSNSPTSSKFTENTISRDKIETSSKMSTGTYVHPSAAESRVRRDTEPLNFFQTSPPPLSSTVKESTLSKDLENNRIAREPESESRKNSVNNAQEGIPTERLRQNEILESKPHASVFTAGGGRLPMANMDGTQVYGTTGVGSETSAESQIVRDATPTIPGKLTVAPDYPVKDEDQDSDERLGKALYGFVQDMLASSRTQSNSNSLTTPEYHVQSPQTEAIASLSYADVGEGIVLSSLAGEKKLNGRKSVQSEWQLYEDPEDQTERELTYTEPSFSHGATRTSGENVRTNILPISSGSCADQNGNQIPRRRKDETNATECAEGSVSGEFLDTEQEATVGEARGEKSGLRSGSEVLERPQSTDSLRDHNRRYLVNLPGPSLGIAYSARGSASPKSAEVEHSAEMAEGSNESDSTSGSNDEGKNEARNDMNSEPTSSINSESPGDSDLPTVSSLEFSKILELTTEDSEQAKNTFITLNDAYPVSNPPIPDVEDEQELPTTPKDTLTNFIPPDVSDVESQDIEVTAPESEFNFSESSKITGPWRSPSSRPGESNSEETGDGYSSPDQEESSARSSARPEATKSPKKVPSDAGRNSTHSKYDTSYPIASTPTSDPEDVGLEGTPASVVRNVLASSENPGTRSVRGKKVESPAWNPATGDEFVSGPIDVGWPKSSPTKNPSGHGTDVEKSRNGVTIASPGSSASVDTLASTRRPAKDSEKFRHEDRTTPLPSDSNTDQDLIVVGFRSTAVTSGTGSISLTGTSASERTSAEFGGTVVHEKLNGFQTNASIIGPNGAEEAWELSSRKAAGLNRARTRSFAEESRGKEPLDGITTQLAVDRTDLEDSRDRRSWPNGENDDDDEVTLPAPLIGPHPSSAHGQRLPKPSKRSGAKLSASGATLANAESDVTFATTTTKMSETIPSGSELPDDKARTAEGTSTMEIDFGPGFEFTLQPAADDSLTASEETFTASESGSSLNEVEEEGEDGSTLGPITRVSSSDIESGQFGRTAHLPDFSNTTGTKDFPLTTAAVSVKGSENSSQDEASLNQWPVKHSAVVEGDLVLGGLMMVHEREDTVTCGPVMPQGGVQALEAMLYTLDTLNDMEIVPGVKIGAHILDDCDKDTYGLEMAVDFIKGSISNIDGAEYHCNKTAVRKVISGVVGAASSVTSIQVANLLRLFRIPQVSFFSTSPELSNKQRFEYFTRTIPSDHYQVKAMVDIVLKMGWSYVSIIYEESNYGIKAFEELEELLAKNEICIAIKEKLVKDSGVAEETAYDNIVLKLLTKPRARGCIIFGSDQEVAGVMRAVRRCNATGAFSWIGSDGWSARGLVSNGNEPEVEGTLSVQPQANPVKGFEEYFLNLTVENNRRNPWFVEFWEDHFQCRYPNASRTPYNQKYTKMCSTKERLTKQNTAFEDQLQFVSDAVMAFAYAFRDMHMDLCDGKAGLCDAMKPTKGTELLKYLRKVDFEGLSGDKFMFDKNGDGPARYNIIHFKQTEPGRYKWIRVGKYLQGELRLNMSEIQFKLGHPQPPESVCSLPCEVGQPKKYVEGERCCWHCFNCTQYQIRHPEDETQCIPCRKGTLPDETHSFCRDIPEEFLRTESGWAIGAMSFSATGILVTLFVAGVFVKHNETPIVRASGRELSYVLLSGILLCYLVTFALVLKPSDIVCGIQRFAVGFCFTVVYAALLTKTNRIARIFNASKHSAKRPSFISPRSQLIICSGLVGVQILINGVWMVIDPARAIHHYPTREDNLLVCNSYIDASYMIAFAYPIMLIVVCTVYAVITRKIPEAFNESKHIGFTMYTTCVIWLAFVPLYFGTGNHVALRITSMSVTISLSASVTIACLFSPKLYIILIRPERNVRQSMMIGKYGTTKSSAATTNASSMMAPVALTAATCDQNKAVKKHIISTIDCSTQSEYYELEVKDQKNGKPPANVMSRSTQTQVSNNEKDTNAVASTNKEKESATTAKPINNNARIGNGPVAQSDVSL